MAAVSVLAALAAGLGLRLWMLKQFFQVNGDSLIYGGLAKNLLLHGQYALTVDSGEMYPTLIRLPGYPLLLALCFRVFGMENYASAAWVQIALELAGCVLLADFARRVAPAALRTGAAHATLWLAALCPFTAVYAANPMAEAPSLFAVALALWAAARFWERAAWGPALWFTAAVSYAALLRPDGALVGLALAPAVAVGAWRRWRTAAGRSVPPRPHDRECGRDAANEPLDAGEALPGETTAGAKAHADSIALTARLKSCPDTSCPPNHLSAEQKGPNLARMAAVCVLLALLPFAGWAWRNWQVFHVFEPLAPRLATDPGEDTHPGWERWVKSWCLDFVSTYDIYWNVPQGQLDLAKLPSRAFDSPAQYTETAALAADYNRGLELTHEIDERFGRLADERIAAHPWRCRVWLPLGRVADMWLRPRVENLPIDLDWWVYARHNAETRFSWAYAGLNALYLLLGVAGLCQRPRFWGAMLAYFLLRSALLTTVEAPEARYTIECFPMLFALGGMGVWWGMRQVGAVVVSGVLGFKPNKLM
jgi:hypothetical protein